MYGSQFDATAGVCVSPKPLLASWNDSGELAVVSDSFTFLSGGSGWAVPVTFGTGSGGWLPPSIYWNYETLNWGYGIIAGGAPELPARGMGCGSCGDRYLFGLKPPMAAMSAMFVIWIIVFCWPKLLLMYWLGEKCYWYELLPAKSTELLPLPAELWL